MSENQTLLEQLEQLLSWKRSRKFYAEKLGITETEVTELLRELKQRDEGPSSSTKNNNLGEQTKINLEKGTLESIIEIDFKPKTHQQLAKLHKIDLKIYKISNYWTKLKSNGNFTSSVFATLKKPQDYSSEDFAEFLKSYKSNYIPILPPKTTGKDIASMELSIADYHLAKKHIDDTNSIEKRALAFFEIAQQLVHKSRAIYDLETIVFPISNDFFHTDNYHGTTTNFTPQDIIVSYDQEYEIGFATLVDTIKMLKANCINVKIILVQGNHDRTKSFYLAHALEVFFKDDVDITFERHHSTIKAVTIGNTFIGYHHGNCKIEDLPLLFATHPIYGKMFGDSKYREVHTGDKHHYMAKEVKGVRIQQMPSLSGTDRWHNDNNFVHSIRAALALLFDKKLGKIAEFEVRI
jgi:hypothetical protein